MLTTLQKINLVLRVSMELGIILGLGYWGMLAGSSDGMKMLLGVGAPALGFGFWGLIDFHQADRLGEPLRLVQELVISGLAAVAWYVAGQHALGWALGIDSILCHALVYVSGDRLLKY